jgi:type IV secretory pathway VirB2 component (pilin)
MINETYCARLVRLLIRSTHHSATLALALTGAVTPAYAQVAGGGGNAGLLSQVINWVATNIIGGLIAAGVLFVGCLLLFGRHTLAGVAVMVIGAIVISQYQTIAAFFGIGG